jgi:enoyl-CoA hydratase
VIAAVNGYALGGGNELALACDLRSASTEARFGQPELGLGNIPGWGGTQRLPRLVGVGRAKEILFTGEMIDAQEAWRIGLVNRVFSPETLMEGTYELAETIASKAPIALQLAKQAVHLAVDTALESGMMYESLGGAFCSRTHDQEEGIKAYREKRSPVFRGK